jgi:hypothetical protein
MLHRPRLVPALLALTVLAACSDTGTPVSQSELELPVARDATVSPDLPVRLNEIHYDNEGTDQGEAVELVVLAGTDLNDWDLVLYNGSNGSVYNTTDLGSAVVLPGDGVSYAVVNFPTNGIQNGAPDGIAVVDPAGLVVEFLSYEGTFTAASGPAAGLSSTDIGASESSGTPLGNSLSLLGGAWVAGPNTFGATNGEPPLPSASINEIHYDNDGADTGEAIEVVTDAPGADQLAGFQLVLYNGSNGTVYGTTDLGSAEFTTVDGVGYAVVEYPSNGIQNGSPDGVALVDPQGVVLEFLSYEGTFEATDGPASGITSTDIGASEPGSTPVGQSLSRQEDDSWLLGPESFGGPNDAPAPPAPAPAVFISELHYDNEGADEGEAVEVSGPVGTDLAGWQLYLYNGNGGAAYATIDLSGVLNCQPGGGLVFEPASGGIQNGPDGLALVDPSGTVVEFLSYEGTFTAADGPAAGQTSVDIGVAESGSTQVGESLQRVDGVWQAPQPNTFGCVEPEPGPQVFLSEARLDQPGADNDEYFEIAGPAGGLAGRGDLPGTGRRRHRKRRHRGDRGALGTGVERERRLRGGRQHLLPLHTRSHRPAELRERRQPDPSPGPRFRRVAEPGPGHGQRRDAGRYAVVRGGGLSLPDRIPGTGAHLLRPAAGRRDLLHPGSPEAERRGVVQRQLHAGNGRHAGEHRVRSGERRTGRHRTLGRAPRRRGHEHLGEPELRAAPAGLQPGPLPERLRRLPEPGGGGEHLQHQLERGGGDLGPVRQPDGAGCG